MSTHHLCPTKMLLVLTTLATSLFCGLNALRAEQPQLVEATLMFRIEPIAALTFPDPSGDDAIGLALDGNNNVADSIGLANDLVFAGFESDYSPTDARYITKGGSFSADVYTGTSYVPPAHGFINLRNSVILDTLASFVTDNNNTLEPTDPQHATDYIILVYGFFEVHSR